MCIWSELFVIRFKQSYGYFFRDIDDSEIQYWYMVNVIIINCLMVSWFYSVDDVICCEVVVCKSYMCKEREK